MAARETTIRARDCILNLAVNCLLSRAFLSVLQERSLPPVRPSAASASGSGQQRTVMPHE